MHLLRLWPTLGMLSLVLVAGASSAGTDLSRKVLIVGIDGTMPSALAVAATPHLDRLMSNGCHSVRVVSHPVTHSAAAWSSMFTGVWGDKHGINDPGNSFAGNRLAEYPSFYQRLESFHAEWNTYALARWSPMLTAVPEADVRLSFGSDAASTDETCRLLTNANPDVMWTLLLDVDSAGHRSGWGPDIPDYVRAIEIADGRVGQIMGAVTNRVTYAEEDWLVIVQTDHGQHDHPDAERSRIVFSIFSGPAAARGVIWPAPAIVDVCATVLTHMGVPIDPGWDLDARLVGLPWPEAQFGTNLLFNGDAEANSGTNDYTPNRGIGWWFDVSPSTLGRYDAHPDFPRATDPGPASRGNQFFLGGAGDGFISQRIDISNLAVEVDRGGMDFTLAGWFGGMGTEEDNAWLTAWFLDEAGAVLGSNEVGRVTAAHRDGQTGLLERITSGGLPPGTRFVDFMLTLEGGASPNKALADNLSFVLHTPTAESLSLVVYGFSETGWRVEFLSRADRDYVLERSENLADWAERTSARTGTGGLMVLIDEAPPSENAFYRVVSRPSP